jgi:hypothetical protein
MECGQLQRIGIEPKEQINQNFKKHALWFQRKQMEFKKKEGGIVELGKTASTSGLSRSVMAQRSRE